jgi:hypothetical protein
MSNWIGYICPEEYILTIEPAVIVSVGGDLYTGDYTVNPDFSGKTLETKNKTMDENVIVKPIEVTRVSNPSGGTTVYIGGIING